MEAVPFQILSIALSSFFFSLSRQKWYLYNKVQEDYTLHILSQTSQLKCVKIQIAGGGMWALYMGNVCVVYKEMQFVPKCSFSPPPTNQAEQTSSFVRFITEWSSIWLQHSDQQHHLAYIYCATHQEKSQRVNSSMINEKKFSFGLF